MCISESTLPMLPNERVSFRRPLLRRKGAHLIITSHFPNPSNQSTVKILWTSGQSARAGGSRQLSSGSTFPFSARAAGLPPSSPHRSCRTAADALTVVQRRRHGGERDCTPGAELPAAAELPPPDCCRSFGDSPAAPAGVLRELNCRRRQS